MSPFQLIHYFYPRSPRGERRVPPFLILLYYNFYPRSPRGERPGRNRTMLSGTPFLSTLPARGATPAIPSDHRTGIISIHAPREGSDGFLTDSFTFLQIFLSTLPARGATVAIKQKFDNSFISIHAPREGSDTDTYAIIQSHKEISIHAPREGSDGQSGHSGTSWYISIHAPREGSDI